MVQRMPKLDMQELLLEAELRVDGAVEAAVGRTPLFAVDALTYDAVSAPLVHGDELAAVVGHAERDAAEAELGGDALGGVDEQRADAVTLLGGGDAQRPQGRHAF